MFITTDQDEFYKPENHPRMSPYEVEAAKKLERAFPCGIHFDEDTVHRLELWLNCIKII